MRSFSKEARAVWLWALACLVLALLSVFGGSGLDGQASSQAAAAGGSPGQRATAQDSR
jgi:hypothetical protein